MPPFNPDEECGGNQARRWRTWLADFKTFLAASNITKKTRQRALLLYQARPRIREIFRHFPEPGADDDIARAEELLTTYFEPQKNRVFEVYKFRQAQQGMSRTIDQFHTRLRSLSTNCEFSDVDFEIMVRILIGGKSSRIRKQALRDPKYTLKDLLLEARREETSKTQAADIEEQLDNEALPALKKPTNRNATTTKTNKKYFNCGGDFPYVAKPCPAKNKICNNCGKQNHFASQCRSGGRSTRQSQMYAKTRKDVRPVIKAEADTNSDSD